MRDISGNPLIVGTDFPEQVIGQDPDIATLLDDTLDTEKFLFNRPAAVHAIECPAIGADPDLPPGIEEQTIDGIAGHFCRRGIQPGDELQGRFGFQGIGPGFGSADPKDILSHIIGSSGDDVCRAEDTAELFLQAFLIPSQGCIPTREAIQVLFAIGDRHLGAHVIGFDFKQPFIRADPFRVIGINCDIDDSATEIYGSCPTDLQIFLSG